MKTKTQEKDTPRDQAKAQLESIMEMVKALDTKSDAKHDDAVQTIQEDALSVEVHDDWHAPGSKDVPKGEYQILLCWGGPSCRIVGTLDEDVPQTAKIEYQDWGTPWTEYRPLVNSGEVEEILLTYARCFTFGE